MMGSRSVCRACCSCTAPALRAPVAADDDPRVSTPPFGPNLTPESRPWCEEGSRPINRFSVPYDAEMIGHQRPAAARSTRTRVLLRRSGPPCRVFFCRRASRGARCSTCKPGQHGVHTSFHVLLAVELFKYDQVSAIALGMVSEHSGGTPQVAMFTTSCDGKATRCSGSTGATVGRRGSERLGGMERVLSHLGLEMSEAPPK